MILSLKTLKLLNQNLERIIEYFKKSHIYVTGSINEPSGNHHIEAAQCGLPILFLVLGLLNIVKVLVLALIMTTLKLSEEMIKDYDYFYNKMAKYVLDSDKMSQNF